MKKLALALLVLVGLGGLAWWWVVPRATEVVPVRDVPSPDALTQQCRDAIGPPRVEQVADDVWVAMGYDLANTVLVRTDAGNIVVDAGMSPERAAPVRDALLAKSPGRVAALVYTHSHIDHVGGASVWVDADTQIWATEAFRQHFLEQYGLFRPAETRRAARQFGAHVDESALPCVAIGRRIDLDAAVRTGARLPTHTFSGAHTLEIGGTRVELVEAHGETHDQLFVWLPERRILLPGDNYYRAFPNLYTIRGTAPRPVGRWIASLDAMRRRAPEVLVPSHTTPIRGAERVAAALTRYRDGIQWLRDRVVQAANDGVDVDTLAEQIGLPAHLASDPALRPLYGQLDWSVRALYGNHLGWFDGRPERLYPLPTADVARRTVAAMGGVDAVRAAIEAADEPRWALHLLSLLADAGEVEKTPGGWWARAKAERLERVAAGLGNTNGRGYLLESALELRQGLPELPTPAPSADLLDAIPMSIFFDVMATRLSPALSIDAHESVHFEFTDTGERYVVTIRRGVAEIVAGEPLPGSPAPIARVRTDTGTWRRVALKQRSPAAAVTAGELEIEGELLDFVTFSRRFDRGL